MDERDWLILSTLYQTKNITRTAEALFITQPALTARLKSIEGYFDVPIVNRTTKGVQFTAAGEYLALKAQRFLLDLQEIQNAAKELSKKLTGTLTIASSGYITLYRLPKLLKAFKKQYPDIEIKITPDWSKNIFSHVFNHDAHVGFASVADLDTVERFLVSEEKICVASMETIDFANLDRAYRIDYQSNYLLRSKVDKWWRENFKHPPKIILDIDKLSNCVEMVRAGLGYAILPSGALRDFPGIHLIPIMDKHGQPITFKTWMMYDKKTLNLKIARVFIDFIKQQNNLL